MCTALTIEDYANNKDPPRRLRKVHQPKKNLSTSRFAPHNADEAAADAVDDDHDGEIPPASSSLPPKGQPESGAQIDEQPPASDLQYASYNDDVWFAIGQHVAPADVGRFALINQQTANICRTATFWTRIYHRTYQAAAATAHAARMPERLQPDCMVRLGGLRTCAIRAFFYCDPVLRERLGRPSSTSVFDLVRRECVGAWSVEAAAPATGSSGSWWHCYRLKRRLPADSLMAVSEALRRRPNFLRKYRDIFQNADESCALLAVRMPAMRPLPKLFGQVSHVAEVRHNLSGHGCAEYRLAVTFVRGGASAASQSDDLVEVVYNPVQEMRVLDWWMPDYHEFVRMGG